MIYDNCGKDVLKKGSADDGPEVELTRFFLWHPEGHDGGIAGCFHVFYEMKPNPRVVRRYHESLQARNR